VSEADLASTIREALAALAAGDPHHKRFGANRHHYLLGPPVEPRDLPGDLATFAATVAGSGAGPGYGLLSLDRSRVVEAPVGLPWTRGVAVGHLGCGHAAVVAIDGVAGEVWIDARAAGVVRPTHPSFTAYYLDWIDHLARGAWPEHHVPPTACALPNALGGFLAIHERRLGLAEGTLAGDNLRAALAELGPGAIAIAAESSVLFDDGTPVDPCVGCARLVENLARDGLRPDVVTPGMRG